MATSYSPELKRKVQWRADLEQKHKLENHGCSQISCLVTNQSDPVVFPTALLHQNQRPKKLGKSTIPKARRQPSPVKDYSQKKRLARTLGSRSPNGSWPAVCRGLDYTITVSLETPIGCLCMLWVTPDCNYV